jgi:hypothetical protein
MMYIESASGQFRFTPKFKLYSLMINMQHRFFGFKHAAAVVTLKFIGRLISYDPKVYGAVTQEKKAVFYIHTSKGEGDVYPNRCCAVGVVFPHDANDVNRMGVETFVKYPLTVLERLCEL